MIKSAHSILGLTLGFWKRPFSQAQHSPLPSDATLPTKMQSGRSACFLTVHLSTQHSWHTSALFLPLYQLDGFYRRIQWWASWGIICSEQKAKVRERGAAEICPLHCSHIVCALPFFFFLLLLAHFILLSPSFLFFSLPVSPSAAKWHPSIDCFSDWFACVWPPSFSGAIHRQCWSRMPGSWRVDIRETVTRGCALIDFPLEWIKSASG